MTVATLVLRCAITLPFQHLHQFLSLLPLLEALHTVDMHVLVILLDFVHWSRTYWTVRTYVSFYWELTYAAFVSFAYPLLGNLLAEQVGDNII